jgi:hypothetical protein
MEFYKIEAPTTKQIFEAIISKQYVPIEKMQSKAKQIKVLLMDHFCSNEILITFSGVTNSGGFPIFLSSSCSMYEIASDQDNEWYNLSEEEQDEEIELLSCYLRTYDDIFNL